MQRLAILAGICKIIGSEGTGYLLTYPEELAMLKTLGGDETLRSVPEILVALRRIIGTDTQNQYVQTLTRSECEELLVRLHAATEPAAKPKRSKKSAAGARA